LGFWVNDEIEMRSDSKWKVRIFLQFFYLVVAMSMLLSVNLCLVSGKCKERKGKGVNFQDFNFFLIDWEDELCLNKREVELCLSKREVLLCAQNLIIFKCCWCWVWFVWFQSECSETRKVETFLHLSQFFLFLLVDDVKASPEMFFVLKDYIYGFVIHFSFLVSSTVNKKL
jgi:hypothetical protein